MIIGQISTADRQVDLGELHASDRLEDAWQQMAERNPRHNTKRYP